MKNTKNKSTSSNDPLQRVLGMGNLDLTYTLNLSEDDVKKYGDKIIFIKKQPLT